MHPIAGRCQEPNYVDGRDCDISWCAILKATPNRYPDIPENNVALEQTAGASVPDHDKQRAG
jgi:hypothetical protein